MFQNDSIRRIHSYIGERGGITVEAYDAVGHEEHEEDDDNPAEYLGHPSAMVYLVAGVLLVLDASHDDGEDGEEDEVAEANPKHGIGLEPLAVGRLVEVVNPCTDSRKRRAMRNSDRFREKKKRTKSNHPEGIAKALTWDGLEEGRGDLAERPGGEEGEREEAAVGDAGGAAADAAARRTARLARARGAARRQARRRPHGCCSSSSSSSSLAAARSDRIDRWVKELDDGFGLFGFGDFAASRGKKL